MNILQKEVSEVAAKVEKQFSANGERLSLEKVVAQVNEAHVASVAEKTAKILSVTNAQGVLTGLAGAIDHTLLKADARWTDVDKLCEDARRFNFATCCVNAGMVRHASERLSGSAVKPIAVIGFPLGATTTAVKVFETKEAIGHGAREIDMVINVGALKDGKFTYVYHDIRAVKEACGSVPLKVIIETCLLTREEKIAVCLLCRELNVAFVKTSTGFSTGGATAEDIRLMRSLVGAEMGVKASGGIRTLADARQMLESGATRIGASASVAIVSGEGAAAGKSGY